MTKIINDFSISVATVNGSGSQSANLIFAKTLFRMGLHVGAKNLFPSNIAGLPTWFTIRVHPEGFVGRRLKSDIFVCKNADTFIDDLQAVASSGYFFYDSEIKDAAKHLRSDVINFAVPFKELSQTVTDSIKMRKFLTNMIYVGVLAELLKLDFSILRKVVEDQFQNKGETVELNFKAIECGQKFAKDNLDPNQFAYSVQAFENRNQKSILIDGNSAAGLGAIVGGCTFLSWYPITPSSSLAESFQSYSDIFRFDESGCRQAAIVQAEDELSAINMVIGAGWAGSRAMTATSGPGLSLMAEAAGLSYFAEVPAVIWNVQRAGPSTGLPTRTLQGDLLAAAHLSHGDTEHIVLLPANPAECFEFAQIAFDLAEEFQTLVIVLSDLDIGMNLSRAPEFQLPSQKMKRGKVLDAAALNELEAKGAEYARYRDVDGDGVCYRTLPGTPHMKAAYFTRGTGHTEKATYSEDGATYAKNLLRLKNKLVTAARALPAPMTSKHSASKDEAPAKSAISAKNVGLAKHAILAYGSSDFVMPEVLSLLAKGSASQSSQSATSAHPPETSAYSQGTAFDYIRVRALPFTSEFETSISQYEKIYVIEQNRDAQMRTLLCEKFARHAHKFISVLSYDGLPLAAENVIQQIEKLRADHGQ
jgi:2-oxoglutarate ferredoxin oxidoreductase subunit alpha